jgi:hypothetical protein
VEYITNSTPFLIIPFETKLYQIIHNTTGHEKKKEITDTAVVFFNVGKVRGNVVPVLN